MVLLSVKLLHQFFIHRASHHLCKLLQFLRVSSIKVETLALKILSHLRRYSLFVHRISSSVLLKLLNILDKLWIALLQKLSKYLLLGNLGLQFLRNHLGCKCLLSELLFGHLQNGGL